MSATHERVVIVGAGPAGSAAALTLAQAGFQPLMLEKDSSPGERNACGGVAARVFGKKLGLPEDVAGLAVARTVVTVGDVSRSFSGDPAPYISFNRCDFDSFLAKKAVAAGARLITSARVEVADAASKRVRWRGADGTAHEVSADVLIFADGPNTMALRHFGIGHRPGTRSRSALVFELEGNADASDALEICVDPAARTAGYFWVFPKKGRINVGVGQRLHCQGPSLQARLNEFIDSRPDLRGRRVISRLAGIVPLDRAQRLVCDGAMVVGDAAGLVNPVTGGGIAFAIPSGLLAGKAAIHALKSGRFDAGALSSYPKRLRMTPHYTWLGMMSLWRRHRLDRLPAEKQAAAHGRMMIDYMSFFHRMGVLVRMVLG